MAHWYFLAFALLCLVCVVVHAWVRGKSFEAKENDENRRIRQQLHAQETAFRNEMHLKTLELKAKQRFLEETRKAFEHGYLHGRRWLARFLGEADKALDNYIALQLRDQHRAVGGAEEELGRLQIERRQLKDRLKFLEYQLATYKEYFPFLEDYDNTILDEAVQLDGSKSTPLSLGHADPALMFLSRDEYSRLDSAARDQLALDRYLHDGLSPVAVGALYDRFIGHLYERDGWDVRYQPVAPGVKGLAQDLICSKDDVIHVVHAKCWAPDRLIHQKHILQLFGTVQWLTIKLSEDQLFPPKIVPRFVTTARLSDMARETAMRLNVEVKENFKLNASFPMIKCSVDSQTRERVYHLPFDEHYDTVRVEPKRGECYVSTVAEAERLGFRRAHRLIGSRGETQSS